MENKDQAPGAKLELDNIDDELKSMAAELAQETNQANQPDPLQIKQQTDNQEETKQSLVMVLAPMFSLLAPAWNIQLKEIEDLSDAYAALIEKYWPGGLGSFGVELNAALITALIIAPRVKMPRKETPQQNDNNQEDEQ